jgi:hypothetical protein
MSAGKGDKLRKRKTIKQWQSILSLKIENYDGFREYNSDDLLTEQEFKKCLNHENH